MIEYRDVMHSMMRAKEVSSGCEAFKTAVSLAAKFGNLLNTIPSIHNGIQQRVQQLHSCISQGPSQTDSCAYPRRMAKRIASDMSPQG